MKRWCAVDVSGSLAGLSPPVDHYTHRNLKVTMTKRYRFNLRLETLYGGDGFERPHTVEEVKLDRSKKTVKVRKDVGVPVEKEMDEKKIEEKEVSVRTFRRNSESVPMYRLGGVHGKFWGLLKEVGYDWYQRGKQENKITTDRVLKSVKVEPSWVVLEKPEGTPPWDEYIEMDVLPQMLEGRSNSMIEMYFDVIPEAFATIELTFPNVYEDTILGYCEDAQTFNFGNKRRGSITIEEAEDVSDEIESATLNVS